MKKIYLLFFLLLLFPMNTKAIYEVIDSRCTDELKISLKEQADALNYRLSRYEKNNIIMYNAYLYNNNENFLLTDINNKKYNNYIESIKAGTKLSINIYASDKTYCNGYKLRTLIINAPYYNKYSKDNLCEGNEEYNLCNENSLININYDEFTKKMKAYILSKQFNSAIKPIEIKQYGFMYYIENHYVNIIIAFLLIIGFLFIKKIYKDNKEKSIL